MRQRHKRISILLLLAMVIQIFTPFMNNIGYAEGETKSLEPYITEIVVNNTTLVNGSSAIFKVSFEQGTERFRGGDTFELKLPEGAGASLKGNPEELDFIMNNKSLGKLIVKEDKVQIEFNDNINNLTNVKGEFGFSAKVQLEEGKESGKIPGELGSNIKTEDITVVEEQDSGSIDFSNENYDAKKWGNQEKSRDYMNWTIRVNPRKEPITEDIVIIDELGEGHILLDEEDEYKEDKYRFFIFEEGDQEGEYYNLEDFNGSGIGKIELDFDNNKFKVILYKDKIDGKRLDLTYITKKTKNLEYYENTYSVKYSKEGNEDVNIDETVKLENDFYAKITGDKPNGNQILIKKFLETEEQPLKGVEFELHAQKVTNGDYGDYEKVTDLVYVTDDEGQIVIDLMELIGEESSYWNEYNNYIARFKLVEVSAPEGVKISENPIEFEYQFNQEGNIIKITNSIEKVDLELEKKWINNKDEISEVKVTVKNNSGLEDIEVELKEDNDWKGKIENLPLYKYKNSEELEKITYWVEEEEIKGYKNKVEGEIEEGKLTITNSPSKLIDLKVNKNWEGDIKEKYKPKVYIKLYRNDELFETKELGSSNKVIFYNLEKYDDKGNEIKYTVKEYIKIGDDWIAVTDDKENRTGYTSEIKGNVEEGYTIKNTQVVRDIEVSKAWEGVSKDTDLPKVTVELLADGEKVDEVTLNKEDNEWTHTFKDLPKYNENGEEIKYEVKEYIEIAGELIEVTGEEENGTGYISEIKGTEEGFTITNTQVVRDIKVSKTWKDVSEDTDLPKVTVELLADGEKVDEVILNKEDNEWTHTFKDLPKYNENGKEIKYKVREVEVKGYTSEVIEDKQDGFIITNTYNPGKLSIPVKKVWKDSSNEVIEDTSTLPEVTVNLLANRQEVDKTIELNKDNQWQGEFKDLPKYDESGKEIVYTVEEVEVDGYEVDITGSAEDGFTITNTEIEEPTPKPETTSVSVNKVWEGTALDNVTVKLLANGEEVGKTIDLNESNNWEGKFENLPTHDDEKEIVYTVEEVEVDGYEVDITGSAEDGFTITNTEIEEPTPKPETTSVSVNKVWKGEALESVTVKLLADGKEVNEVILSEDNNWTHTFEEIDKFNDESGKEIEYTVKEVKVEGYTANITGNAKDGFTITNTKDPEPVEPEDPPKPDKPIEPEPAPETVSLTVKKAWIGEPTERVLVQLVANGQRLEVVELRESNNWTHVFSNLVKYNSDGSEIEYSVVEIDVPDGYTEEYSRPEEDTILITNIKDDEPEPKPEDPKPSIPVEPDTPEPEEPEEPEIPEVPEEEEPEEPEEDVGGVIVEPEDPEDPKEPELPEEEEEPEVPEEDVGGVIVDPEEEEEEPVNPEEDVAGVVVDEEEDKVEDEAAALPKTGENSTIFLLLGLVFIMTGIILKRKIFA